ncbi:MAG: SCO family protein, partial [Cyclobacteriaceae bacterium]|nr:SCO family protein [Cyclobacteriaceae bacterium]
MLARSYSFCYLILFAILCFACSSGSNENSTSPPLPILGERYVEEGQDTVFHTIADFSLLNQMGDTLHRADVLGKVYVADFFFTSCPTICPVMKKEML